VEKRDKKYGAHSYFIYRVLTFDRVVDLFFQLGMFGGYVFDVLSDRQKFTLHCLQVPAIRIQVFPERLQIVLYGDRAAYPRRLVDG